MKARLGLLVVLALLSTLLAAAMSSPAQASPFGARLSRNPPIVGEVVKIYGAVTPAKRPVRLQRWSRGHWVSQAYSRTGSGGAYAFNVRAYSTSVAYRVYAPKKRVHHKKAAKRTSNTVRVTGVKPTMSLGLVPAPVGIDTSTDTPADSLLTPGVATFRPARPGALVYIQRYLNGGWVTVPGGIGRQDATGSFKFKGIAAGSSSDVRAFRALSAPGNGVRTTSSRAVFPAYWPKNFDDNFTDPAYSSQHWKTREFSHGSNHACAQSDDGLHNFANGVATIAVQKLETTADCPYGYWGNGVIGTGSASIPFTQQYGVFAARIRFQYSPGSHGAFWLQGMSISPNSAEVDVAENFGAGRGLANFVHVEEPGKITSSGGVQNSVGSILGRGNTTYSGYHVYSVQWSPSGYIFRVDGVPTFSTNKPRAASVPEEMVLSLATSDYELPRMGSANYASMQVDWARTWTSP